MDISRRKALGLVVAGAAGGILQGGLAGGSARQAQASEVNADGLHLEPWFAEESFEMPKDAFEQAFDEGKNLAVFWEQRGCPYCREMHEVNLAKPEIADYIKNNFVVVLLNLYGARDVTDFDGESMSERKLSKRWLVNFTPTVNLFPLDKDKVLGHMGRDAEAFRIPGYFKPFHFVTAFEYVRDKHYERLGATGFQTFINERAARLRKEGKEVDIW